MIIGDLVDKADLLLYGRLFSLWIIRALHKYIHVQNRLHIHSDLSIYI
jgi:hypothetical protein